jgi:hypothetical protein
MSLAIAKAASCQTSNHRQTIRVFLSQVGMGIE